MLPGVVDHHAGVQHEVVPGHPLEDVRERQERQALLQVRVVLHRDALQARDARST